MASRFEKMPRLWKIRLGAAKNSLTLDEKLTRPKSGPFSHGLDHLGQVGDFPFRCIAHERYFTLIRHRLGRTAQLHDAAAALSFLRFDFTKFGNLHNSKTICLLITGIKP